MQPVTSVIEQHALFAVTQSVISLQLWKNDTVAEQDKRSPKEKPVLLSKDIESKLALLDREINYLLNKAKFAKPKKVKNATSTDKGSKANSTAEGKKEHVASDGGESPAELE